MSSMRYPDPSQYPGLASKDIPVVQGITKLTREYFQNPKFDASHDFEHVLRVTNNAIAILEEEKVQPDIPCYDVLTVILGSLLHDVGDKKYFSSAEGELSKIQTMLAEVGIVGQDAERIQTLVEGVSYSSEVKNPQAVMQFISEIPELAIVQDADRLDAIGAIGIGRCFAFSAKIQARSLAESLEHFVDKLLKLEGMMKTKTGRKMAAVRSRRILQFMEWWKDEGGPLTVQQN